MRGMAIIAATVLTAMQASGVTVTLQQGLNGYAGCKDAELRNPSINYNDKGPYADRYWAIEF